MTMPTGTRAAFERLLAVARTDTGQARRVANFLLAWWNAESLGGFDLTELFAVDEAIALDMAAVFSWLATQESAVYPTEYRSELEVLIREWRPEVWEQSSR